MNDNTEQLNQLPESDLVKQVFEDSESKANIVGLFTLLWKIDKRIAPENYSPKKDD